MSKVGQRERITQNRVVAFFRDTLGYEYLGDWKERPNNRNIEPKLLTRNLQKRGYSDAYISKAIQSFSTTAGNQQESLYQVNKAVYSQLRYGVKFRPSVGEKTATVWLIDWAHPDRNDFAIAEEVTIGGHFDRRPDIVLYVNGIALGVLELKRSTVNISEGIRQNISNQQPEFNERFFTTMQLVMAGNDSQGLRYGTIGTSEKYYLNWQEERLDIETDHLLDNHLAQMCGKERLLEIIHDFIIFDTGTKKICRHNQYFGVTAAQKRLQQNEGGIIWHTQGSGKSLTMVWLSRWIKEHFSDARVLVITDRTELDEQIEKVYSGVDEDIYRTKSGADLIEKLGQTTPLLMCSLIHKFPGKDEGDVNNYLEELTGAVPADFQAHGKFFVFVDECHRTQSGVLHQGMHELLPDAIFIGFTGTPLLKVDKERRTSIETFGTYIHTYKYNEAVSDGVVLDLRYEARKIEQYLSSPEKVDQWFESKTSGLTDVATARLKQRWGTMRSVLSARERLEQIVNDIYFDMQLRPRLQSGEGNALLVAGSIYEACKFYELFQSKGFTKCAIITSYEPNPADIKLENSGEGETQNIKKYNVYQQMLNGQSPKAFEQRVKKQFIEEPAQMKLLIVVDKLLTGFDAPSATYLYIDKTMRDHGLFQAICRVNRLDSPNKEYGYIIDYKDLFRSLESAIQDYTSGAFENFDKADVQGLLSNRLDKARERLEDARDRIKALCEPVEPPGGTQQYISYFCGDTSDPEALKDTEARRLDLYKYTVSLLRAYANLASDMQEAGYTPQEADEIRDEVGYYENVREEIQLASYDKIDLKQYEPGMRQLLDMYIRAHNSEKISSFDDMSLVELIVERGQDAIKRLSDRFGGDRDAVAEAIENNVRRVIIDENTTNPTYYERMSKLLNTLIEARRKDTLDYQAYLEQMVELTKQVHNPSESTDYPETINTPTKRALFDKLEKEAKANSETLANQISQAVQKIKKHNWRDNPAKESQVKQAIYNVLEDEDLTKQLFKIIYNQRHD